LHPQRPQPPHLRAAAGRHHAGCRICARGVGCRAGAGFDQAGHAAAHRESEHLVVMRVAITGAAGMLGSRLAARLLSEGHSVYGVDIRPSDQDSVQWTVADVRDAAAMKRAFADVDTVIHTASALPSYPEPEIRSIIVDGTDAVLTAAAETGIARVLHV